MPSYSRLMLLIGSQCGAKAELSFLPQGPGEELQISALPVIDL